ncbi:leucine-rich repeat domain-containing protein [Maliponia aquimaris]|uniref:Internalin-A n=1 Tax=Maliponia aquimaris TaxID=1673631 RepID=A0A238KBE9_9RHOB|nr:leucine-rich repeat domain-containing protein [Maliponia aquimaris]SMX39482.1 Internalin-A precursor [Maliponia aquimaris]
MGASADEAALEAAIREDIQDAKINRRDGLSFLYYASDVPIRALPPQIGRLDWMTWLDLEGTQITDLSPIAPLTRLEKLDLRGLPVTDLSPLAGMTRMGALMLEGTGITDISVAARFPDLQELRLDGTQVTDFAPLADCRALRCLSVRRTAFSDLGLLADLPELETLDLTGTQVDDITPLLRFPRFMDPDSAASILLDDTPVVTRNKVLARINADSGDPLVRARDLIDHLTGGGLMSGRIGHA